MKNYIIMITLFTNGLALQAGITTLLKRFPQNNTRLSQNTKNLQKRLYQSNNKATIQDVVRKSNEMTSKHGVGMGYFLSSLKVLDFNSPTQMIEYLNLVDAHAQAERQEVPSASAFTHWKNQQEPIKK